MKAYISISYKNRRYLQGEVAIIMNILTQAGFTPFLFVDHYNFEASQERIMMMAALKHIDSSTLFIAEVSEKAIGVGVEAGYAKSKGIPIIYVRNAVAEHSTTISGISDVKIIYHSTSDLMNQLYESCRLFIGKQGPSS